MQRNNYIIVQRLFFGCYCPPDVAMVVEEEVGECTEVLLDIERRTASLDC